MGDVILRKCRLKYLGIKDHMGHSFGMIHKTKLCVWVGIVRKEANAGTDQQLINLSEGHVCVYLYYSINFSRSWKFFKIQAKESSKRVIKF